MRFFVFPGGVSPFFLFSCIHSFCDKISFILFSFSDSDYFEQIIFFSNIWICSKLERGLGWTVQLCRSSPSSSSHIYTPWWQPNQDRNCLDLLKAMNSLIKAFTIQKLLPVRSNRVVKWSKFSYCTPPKGRQKMTELDLIENIFHLVAYYFYF